MYILRNTKITWQMNALGRKHLRLGEATLVSIYKLF